MSSMMCGMLLGAGVNAKKTYVDDVFSTYLYKGTGSARSINNAIDVSGDGAMVWIKSRSLGLSHQIFDTVRGATQVIASDNNYADWASTTTLTAFNNNGFSLGTNSAVNSSGDTYGSFTFRKAKGFFDVVTYTGNGSNRTIAHSLGSLPGCMMIKCTSETRDWAVYHWDLNSYSPGSFNPNEVYLELNDNSAAASSASVWHLQPTTTHFSVGTNDLTNKNGETYVAYIFAGGESTDATARAIEFDGSDDQLNIPDSTDWDLGNGDFTLETWIKSTQTTDGYFTALGQWQDSGNNRSWMIRSASIDIGTGWSFFYSTNGSNYTTTMGSDISDGQWHHIAVTRTGGNLRTFTDGILNTTRSTSDTFYAGAGTFTIGGQSGNYFDGQLSNVRLVKGTALYTSSFRLPTKPLTNVTNTKLLCCNNSSTTGSTVTPGTITASGVPITTKNGYPIPSPFSDPAGFVFGENEDQNVIKCGSYKGNGSSSGPKINLGWEPSWVMIKISSGANYGWTMLDTMRGIPTGGNNARLRVNESGAEDTAMGELINVNPTGFQLKDSTDSVNASGNTYVYMAIRRPDGYVGKPPELGTGVFTMDTGNSSSTIPTFDSGFPVDMALRRAPASSMSFWLSTRLQGPKDLGTASGYSGSESTDANSYTWDSNAGWASQSGWSSSQQSWMWKRHAGFDVVTYKGNNTAGSSWSHSLGKIPEMIWIKNRGTSADWAVGHKGLNGGTNPWNYRILLNSNAAESSANDYWGGSSNTGKPPTSTHFFLGSAWTESNANNNDYIAMLFASVDGISKVGSYTGSSSNVSVTTGFQPRFVIIKRNNNQGHWAVFDTVRGINSSGTGGDYLLYLNSNMAGTDANGMIGTWIDLSSTGFTVSPTWAGINGSSESEYIYYAHA